MTVGVASRMESALASTDAEDSDPGMADFHAMARAAERSVKSRRDEIGAAPAVDASAGDVSQVEAVVPAPAVADDALLRLNTQQLAAVNLSRGSANIFICGGGGVGKSETVTAMINDSKKVNAVMGPHHSSLSIITRKCKNTLSPEVFATTCSQAVMGAWWRWKASLGIRISCAAQFSMMAPGKLSSVWWTEREMCA